MIPTDGGFSLKKRQSRSLLAEWIFLAESVRVMEMKRAQGLRTQVHRMKES